MKSKEFPEDPPLIVPSSAQIFSRIRRHIRKGYVMGITYPQNY